MSSPFSLPAGTVFNSHLRQYTIIRTLGAGGFGITYLVEAPVKIGNIESQVKFAVKEHFVSMLCQRDSTSQSVTCSITAEETVVRSRRAFVKEAERLQSLGIDHPNMVRINEVFEANDTAYYVMEYLDGETLADYVQKKGALSAEETERLLRPIAEAVAVLHRNNLTHYDIKPANIILEKDKNGSIRPVLIDFGLSKHYDDKGAETSTLNSSGFSKGYSPAEQYMGLREFTPQADVYALAATIYFCLTGQRPEPADVFKAETLTTRLEGLLSDLKIATLKRAMARDKETRTPNGTIFYEEFFEDNIGDITYAMPRPNHPEDDKTRLVVQDSPTKKSKRYLWIGLIFLLAIGVSAAIWFSGRRSATMPDPRTWGKEPLLSEAEVLASARQRYDVVGTFKDGFAVVGIGNKFGIIDRVGILVVDCRYDHVDGFSDGMARVFSDGHYGFVNTNGEYLDASSYDSVEEFSEGRALVNKGGKFGFIDHQGNEVIPLIYSAAASFAEGLAPVMKDNRAGFIDKDGNTVIHLIYDYVQPFSDGVALVTINDKGVGYINKQGEVVVPFEYQYGWSFEDGFATVLKDGIWYLIDKTNQIVKTLDFDTVGPLKEGFAPVQRNGKGGFIDKTGRVAVPLIYDDLTLFSEGLSAVQTNGKWRVIDTSGEEAFPLEFDSPALFKDGFTTVTKDGKQIFVERNGRQIELAEKQPSASKEVTKDSSESLILTGEGIGPLRLGMVLSHVPEKVPGLYDSLTAYTYDEDVDLDIPNNIIRTYSGKLNGQYTISFSLDDEYTICNITLLSSEIPTECGLRVGDSIEKAMSLPGAYQEEYSAIDEITIGPFHANYLGDEISDIVIGENFEW